MSTPEFKDDPTIANEDPLWRRIHPEHVVPNGEGGVKISSAAFSDSSNGHPMSVVLGVEVLRVGRDPRSCLKGSDDYGLAAITAGLARETKQGVQRDEIDEEPAHALVFGPKPKSVQRRYATAATRAWVVHPPEHVIEARRRA
jgi:hypothetical protein